jgi:uncharacterized protein YodC (DUF2158 family)
MEEAAIMEMTFKKGDKVTLATGGAPMLITAIGATISCRWFNANGDLKDASDLDPATLQSLALIQTHDWAGGG